MKQTDKKNKNNHTSGNTIFHILKNSLSATTKEEKKAGGELTLYKD